MPNSFSQRGEIYYANLDPVVGSKQGGRRPILIIQNDISNQRSPVLITASMTSAPTKINRPTDVLVQPGPSGLTKPSRVLLNQIKTINKQRLENYIGRLSAEQMIQVDEAIKISLGLVPI